MPFSPQTIKLSTNSTKMIIPYVPVDFLMTKQGYLATDSKPALFRNSSYYSTRDSYHGLGADFDSYKFLLSLEYPPA